jgi:hypothetical protein
MHSWRAMIDLLQQVDRPKILGFQADMAHTLLYALGYNAPEARILPVEFDWDWTISKDLPQGGTGLWRLDAIR